MSQVRKNYPTGVLNHQKNGRSVYRIVGLKTAGYDPAQRGPKMPEKAVSIEFKLNLKAVMIMVVAMHALFLMTKRLKNFGEHSPDLADAQTDEYIEPIKLMNLRKVGVKDSKFKDSIYLKDIHKDRWAPKIPVNPADHQSQTRSPKKLSFKDLTTAKTQSIEPEPKPASTPAIEPRPGTRPVAFPEKTKAIEAISLRGGQIHKFSSSTASNAADLSGDPRAAALNTSDILVKLEVPEGVSPDELNQYELMFYGFQRRTATNYINSLFKELDKFERSNPHLHFPMTENKQVMTGRLIYDEKGNLKQIKMIRWSNQEKLQDFFEDVLKNMDTLHNPPHVLWEKRGEFAIFFSLQVNS